MTRSREGGENEFTRMAKLEAKATGADVCGILAAWLADARSRGDEHRAVKIRKAQKYLGCRNVRKRRSS